MIKKKYQEINSRNLPNLSLNPLFHQINTAVKSRVKSTKTRYLKSLINLRNERPTYNNNINQISFIKNTVNNVLSHTLAEYKQNILAQTIKLDYQIRISNQAFGLNYQIPKRTNRNIIEIEFELYLQIINSYVSEIPDNIDCCLKTKLRNICDKSNRIRVSYKFRKIVEKKSRDKNMMVLKEDKGRGVIVTDGKKYIEKWKCFNLLHTQSFIQFDHDPIKTIEIKIQMFIFTIRNNLTK